MILRSTKRFARDSLRSGLRNRSLVVSNVITRISRLVAYPDRRSIAGWKPANTAVISGRSCVTVGIANGVAWMVEAASGIGPASKNALQKLIPDVASVTGKATPFTVQDTRA